MSKRSNVLLLSCLLTGFVSSSYAIMPSNSNKLASQSKQKIEKKAQKIIATKINLNQASAKVIAKSFKGIGKKRAQAIVEYRNNHGAFKDINELSRVMGISLNFVKKHNVRLKETFAL